MKIVATLLLLASAAVAQNSAPDQSPISAALTACGPANIKFQSVSQGTPRPDAAAEEGKALVYIIEDQRQIDPTYYFSENITIKVGIDGAWVGANENNSYLSLAVPSGEHHLCVNWQSRFTSRNQQYGLAHFSAEPGKVYYFLAKAVMWRQRNSAGDYNSLTLEPIDSDQGRYLVTLAPANMLQAKK